MKARRPLIQYWAGGVGSRGIELRLYNHPYRNPGDPDYYMFADETRRNHVVEQLRKLGAEPVDPRKPISIDGRHQIKVQSLARPGALDEFFALLQWIAEEMEKDAE